MRRSEDESLITPGSGNVFADLGLPAPEERLAKARLASRIQDGLEARGWGPEQVAEGLSVSEVEVSRLLVGRLKGFSVERLTGLLVAVEGAG
jgi:predicted XRE-type DNA-binding protein